MLAWLLLRLRNQPFAIYHSSSGDLVTCCVRGRFFPPPPVRPGTPWVARGNPAAPDEPTTVSTGRFYSIPGPCMEIGDYRRQIDALDVEIVRLLNERAGLA